MNYKTVAFLIFLGVGGLIAFFYGAFYEYRKKYRREQPATDD